MNILENQEEANHWFVDRPITVCGWSHWILAGNPHNRWLVQSTASIGGKGVKNPVDIKPIYVRFSRRGGYRQEENEEEEERGRNLQKHDTDIKLLNHTLNQLNFLSLLKHLNFLNHLSLLRHLLKS